VQDRILCSGASLRSLLLKVPTLALQ
jgi:hypothetical protein